MTCPRCQADTVEEIPLRFERKRLRRCTNCHFRHTIGGLGTVAEGSIPRQAPLFLVEALARDT